MKPIYLSIQQQETGENIRRLLKSNGYTVKDIQEVMGFENPQAVYKWLSGKSLPSLENLLILSKLLNISFENILVIDEDINILRSINTQWMLNRINYVLVIKMESAIIESDVRLSTERVTKFKISKETVTKLQISKKTVSKFHVAADRKSNYN